MLPYSRQRLGFQKFEPHLQASIQELKRHRLTMTTASKMANTKQDFSLVIDRNTGRIAMAFCCFPWNL